MAAIYHPMIGRRQALLAMALMECALPHALSYPRAALSSRQDRYLRPFLTCSKQLPRHKVSETNLPVTHFLEMIFGQKGRQID